MNYQNNPLIEYARATDGRFPPFDTITADHFIPAFDITIASMHRDIAVLIDRAEKEEKELLFDTVIVGIETLCTPTQRIILLYSHYKELCATPEISALGEAMETRITSFSSSLFLNDALFQLIKKVSALYAEKVLPPRSQEDMRLLETTYDTFVRQGALLSVEQKEILRTYDEHIAQLQHTFSVNVQKTVQTYEYVVTDSAFLKGLPDHCVAYAKKEAEKRGHVNAWVFTLEGPVLMDVLQHAEHPTLRKALWFARQTQASSGPYDNRPVLRTLVETRHKRAQLFGYASHAEYVLSARMAKTKEAVEQMQHVLADIVIPLAKKELTLLSEQKGAALDPWDVSFYEEKYKKEKYTIDPALVRNYFPHHTVVEGLFSLLHTFFGVHAVKNTTAPVHHHDVMVYDFFDDTDRYWGTFFLDLFPRPTKRQGAWVEIIQSQQKDIRPHILISLNMTPLNNEGISLMSMYDVYVLFHECGHALHCLLSECSYPSLSGFNGVLWDFVELPSQFFEAFAFHPYVLDRISKQYQTGESLPADYCSAIANQRKEMNAGRVLGQLLYGILDMAWYDGRGYEALQQYDDTAVESFERKITAPYRSFPQMEGALLSTAFRHVFGGGYDAGYYSYLWAEALAADAFEFVQTGGQFDSERIQAFRTHILSKGNSEDPMILYKRFRGSEPKYEPLLRAKGIL